FPDLDITPVIGDYTQSIQLPATAADTQRRIGYFSGSTLGNLEPDEALSFLERARHWLAGGGLLLGADLIKHPGILHAAYNDAQGVTAAFNRNVLYRANRELNANFEPAAYAHSAFYNAPMRRIEMHLM